jgi:hypothetical protein
MLKLFSLIYGQTLFYAVLIRVREVWEENEHRNVCIELVASVRHQHAVVVYPPVDNLQAVDSENRKVELLVVEVRVEYAVEGHQLYSPLKLK